jgi:radical SAM protein with 4Fe4S-binding SPASM domain
VKPLFEGTDILISIPSQKFRDTSNPTPKSYERCLACPNISFIAPPEANVYICHEWGGAGEFAIGNLKYQSMKEIWSSEKRQKVIEMVNSEALKNRCPPVCAMHELNILLSQIEDMISKDGLEEVKRIISAEKNKPQPKDIYFLYPATMPTSNEPDRAPKKDEFQVIVNAFGGRGASLNNSRNKDNTVIRASLAAPAEVRGGILYVNPNTLRGPPEQLKVIFEGHELYHLLGIEEQEAQKLTIKYLLGNIYLKTHIKFLQKNDLCFTPRIPSVLCTRNQLRLSVF